MMEGIPTISAISYVYLPNDYHVVLTLRLTFALTKQWSNFEVGDLNWLRSDAYLDYFNHLDQDGGFFYERWGDAPVHSIAAALMLKKEEIHFFDEIAYYHVPFTHCPTSEQKRLDLRCTCRPEKNFDWTGFSCMIFRFPLQVPQLINSTGTSRFFDINNMPKPEGYDQQTG